MPKASSTKSTKPSRSCRSKPDCRSAQAHTTGSPSGIVFCELFNVKGGGGRGYWQASPKAIAWMQEREAHASRRLKQIGNGPSPPVWDIVRVDAKGGN
jgi:hypothetical protein